MTRSPHHTFNADLPITGIQRARWQKRYRPAGDTRTVFPVAFKVQSKKFAHPRVFWLAVGLLAVAAVIYLLIWFGPDLLARHDIGNITGPPRVLRLQHARDAARGRLLTLGAGIFAALALVFSVQNYLVARRTLAVTEQGQVTDRFTKAIDHLGSSRLDVRIGGIYSLEQIARDSTTEHPIVVEVLSSFIRRHSQEPLNPYVHGGREPGRSTRPDIQAAITVLGRRDEQHDSYILDLNGADLTGAILDGAKLTALFADTKGDLYLGLREFTDEPRIGAYLDGVKFIGATLKYANLAYTSVTNADFTRADLTGALWPEGAELPDGWTPEAGSGRLRRASTSPEGET